MEIMLALCAAAVYGIADYSGGRASRTVSPIVVTAIGQGCGLIFLAVIVLASGVPTPPATDWFWGGIGGIAGASGLLAFYKAMGSGFMAVVAPVSALTATAVPVIVGLSLGERPSVLSLCGIPVALVAIALISDILGPNHRRAPRKIFVMAFGAGSVFGSLFVILGHTSDNSGLWPVLAMRVTSVPFMFVVMYFIMIRPQMKRQKEHKAMVEALAKGDEVVAGGGILGKLTAVDETTLGLEVAKGVEVQVQRSSVVQVLPKGTLK